jgi:predicted nuclease of predicted toxin-antitoxin system
VRILLDESLPRQLAQSFPGHYVSTVVQQQWTGLKNGDLLRRAKEEGFEVFVTADQNLEYQQNLVHSGLGIVVVKAARNRMTELRPLIPSLLDAVLSARPGTAVRVGG